MTFENRKSSLIADLHNREMAEKMSMRHKRSNPLNTPQIAGDDEDLVSLGHGFEGALEMKLEGIPEAPTTEDNIIKDETTNNDEQPQPGESKPFSLMKFLNLIKEMPEDKKVNDEEQQHQTHQGQSSVKSGLTSISNQ
jgi:hypothetical protein